MQNLVQHTRQFVKTDCLSHYAATISEVALSEGMPRKSIGAVLKEKREAAGISQYDLADRTGLSRGTIAAIETDVPKAVKDTTLRALANALGMKLDEFYMDEPMPNIERPATLAEFLASSAGKDASPKEIAQLEALPKSLAPGVHLTFKSYGYYLDMLRSIEKGDE
jgi:transcriptional regulator with XRE-family HTH domain